MHGLMAVTTCGPSPLSGRSRYLLIQTVISFYLEPRHLCCRFITNGLWINYFAITDVCPYYSGNEPMFILSFPVTLTFDLLS